MIDFVFRTMSCPLYPRYMKMQVYSPSVFIQCSVAGKHVPDVFDRLHPCSRPPCRERPCAAVTVHPRQLLLRCSTCAHPCACALTALVHPCTSSSRLALNKYRRTRLWLPASLYRLHPWSRLNPASSNILGIGCIFPLDDDSKGRFSKKTF